MINPLGDYTRMRIGKGVRLNDDAVTVLSAVIITASVFLGVCSAIGIYILFFYK